MTDAIWVGRGGEKHGPYPVAHVLAAYAQEELSPTDLLWWSGLAKWEMLESALPQLRNLARDLAQRNTTSPFMPGKLVTEMRAPPGRPPGAKAPPAPVQAHAPRDGSLPAVESVIARAFAQSQSSASSLAEPVRTEPQRVREVDDKPAEVLEHGASNPGPAEVRPVERKSLAVAAHTEPVATPAPPAPQARPTEPAARTRIPPQPAPSVEPHVTAPVSRPGVAAPVSRPGPLGERFAPIGASRATAEVVLSKGRAAQTAPRVETRRAVEHAGFWRRYAALVIDGLLLVALVGVIGYAGGLAVVGPEASPVKTQALYGFLGLLAAWLYFAALESGEARATLGKRLFRIQVVRARDHARIGLGRATARFFARLLSVLTLMIGYFIQPFTARRQALHDQISGCEVIVTGKAPRVLMGLVIAISVLAPLGIAFALR